MRHRLFSIFLALATLTVMPSCMREDIVSPDGNAIGLKASVRGMGVSGTRSPITDTNTRDTIPVETGDYTVTYAHNNGIENGVARFIGGKGTFYPMSGERPIQWDDFGENRKYEFVLDNIPEPCDPKLEQSGKDSLTFVGPDWSGNGGDKYKAGPETGLGEGNDVLWGRTKVDYKTNPVNFRLYHRMSRVNVVVTSLTDAQIESGQISVSLKNVVERPDSFNRLTGEVAIAGNPEYSTVAIAENQQLTKDGENANLDESGAYISPNLILPPQHLQDGKLRTRLVVTIAGKTYSAALPTGMVDESEHFPHTLAFLQGNHVTLRVRLSDAGSDPTIQFMPVLVKDWVDVGTYPLNGLPIDNDERGIHDMEELEHLIYLYNRQPSASASISYDLLRYGTYEPNTKKWVFNLLADIPGLPKHLMDADIYYDYPFDIAYNGHTINGRQEKTDLLDGEIIRKPGIYDLQDLYECMRLYNLQAIDPATKEEAESMVTELSRYGTYESYVENGKPKVKWTFIVPKYFDFTKELFFNYYFYTTNYPVLIEFEGKTVTGADLGLISPGIYNTRDLSYFIDLYNQQDRGKYNEFTLKLNDMGYVESYSKTSIYVKYKLILYDDIDMPDDRIRKDLMDVFVPELDYNGHTVGGSNDPSILIKEN